MAANAAIELYDAGYQRIVDGDDDFMSMPAENFIRLFKINNLHRQKRSNAKALDFGCGEGRHTEFLIRSGYQVVATDVSDAAIAATEKRMPESENLRTQKIESPADLRAIPNMYRLAVAWEVLHWIGEEALWVDYLKTIVSQLEDNGVLICTMPTEDHHLIKFSEEYKENHFLCHAETRASCTFFAPKRDQLLKYFDDFGVHEVQTIRYEQGRDENDMSLDNRFSMYAFYLRF
jgi:cyclopropane fatty-acyl-phospholipid synthase-like methyltransferase